MSPESKTPKTTKSKKEKHTEIEIKTLNKNTSQENQIQDANDVTLGSQIGLIDNKLEESAINAELDRFDKKSHLHKKPVIKKREP